jgi:hypothetical protein
VRGRSGAWRGGYGAEALRRARRLVGGDEPGLSGARDGPLRGRVDIVRRALDGKRALTKTKSEWRACLVSGDGVSTDMEGAAGAPEGTKIGACTAKKKQLQEKGLGLPR